MASNETYRDLLFRLGPFDLVYERYSLWSFAGMQYAEEVGIPGILEVNAPLIEEQQLHRSLHHRELAETVAREAFGSARSIVTVSDAVAGYLRASFGVERRVSVHPNGVDTGRIHPEEAPSLPADDGVFTIGFVGSLKPWHGLSVLADSFVELSRRGDIHARLLVVGDGPVREEMEARLDSAGMMDRCVFTGKVPPDAIPGLLTSMDVAVAPAFQGDESGDYFSPLKLFEYMAAGLPSVCSRSGQMVQIVRDGIDGLLFTPGAHEELTRALVRLHDDVVLRADLGLAAREAVVAHHDWKSVVAGVLKTVRSDRPEAETMLRAV